MYDKRQTKIYYIIRYINGRLLYRESSANVKVLVCVRLHIISILPWPTFVNDTLKQTNPI